MKHMQIIHAQNVESARQTYLRMLDGSGIGLGPGTELYIEAVHQGKQTPDTWLCYVARPQSQAA